MKRRVKTIITAVFCGVVLLTMIAFSGKKHGDRPVSDLKIEIVDHEGNLFIDQLEVTSLINAENTDFVLGLNLNQLDLKELERRVEVNAFVRDAQVFHDLKGNLNVRLKQAVPIARVFFKDDEDYYIDESGLLLPLNSKHTARVPILEYPGKNPWSKNINESKKGAELLKMLQYIENDPFWKAQVAHLVMDKKGEMNMLTQIGKQEVIFGKPEDLDTKFKKLKTFYKEVLPAKGWNTYAYVNVKYKNQIVCK